MSLYDFKAAFETKAAQRTISPEWDMLLVFWGSSLWKKSEKVIENDDTDVG